MLRTWVCTLCHMTTGRASKMKRILSKWVSITALILLGAMPVFSALPGGDNPNPKPPAPANGPQEGDKKWPGPGAWPNGDRKWPGPGGWQEGDKKWPTPDASIEATAKRLEQSKSVSQPGPEVEFLYSKASDLLDRSKQSREDRFKFDRFIMAANFLISAGDIIVNTRKMDHTAQEHDYWGAGMVLPGLDFRVKLAGFFAVQSGEKNSEQCVTLARTLYQQARGAYDVREYQRARFLADASGSVVLALESIAHAVHPAPKPPHIFK